MSLSKIQNVIEHLPQTVNNELLITSEECNKINQAIGEKLDKQEAEFIKNFIKNSKTDSFDESVCSKEQFKDEMEKILGRKNKGFKDMFRKSLSIIRDKNSGDTTISKKLEKDVLNFKEKALIPLFGGMITSTIIVAKNIIGPLPPEAARMGVALGGAAIGTPIMMWGPIPLLATIYATKETLSKKD